VKEKIEIVHASFGRTVWKDIEPLDGRPEDVGPKAVDREE